jgi:uncharacterized MAPEG superfamily protein
MNQAHRASVAWDGGKALLAVLLALVIVWIVLGIIGFVVHGLFWLFVIACVLFVVTVLAGTFRRGRHSTGPNR